MSVEHEHKAYREGYIAGMEVWNRAIEEAARVVERLDGAETEQLAAAIRALKEKK